MAASGGPLDPKSTDSVGDYEFRDVMVQEFKVEASATGLCSDDQEITLTAGSTLEAPPLELKPENFCDAVPGSFWLLQGDRQ